jgi:hypothetical protein
MYLLPLIFLPLVLSAMILDSPAATWLMALSQLAVLLTQVRTKQVTGTGGFLFMSFLFFGVRPLYIIIENDYVLFGRLFRISVDLQELNEGMWWGSCATVAFWLGSVGFRHLWLGWRNRQNQARGIAPVPVLNNTDPGKSRFPVSTVTVTMLVLYQIFSLFIMFYLSKSGRLLYDSSLGAYVYDMPVPLQSGHIFTLIVILERFLHRYRFSDLFMLMFSGVLFMIFTWLMREVSMFRGFYIAGIMIAGIAVLLRLRGRVPYVWLIAPIVLLQPLFQTLGETRAMDNRHFGEKSLLERTFDGENALKTYWDFYDSNGDINIFDTFVAARASHPDTRAYIMSWVYVPFHFIPRKWWPAKPRKGILQDFDFMFGAPYCPGIAGLFLLDGGELWMLVCMLALGGIIGQLDVRVLLLPNGYLKACLVGILVVNCMFLSRFFLWQAFYQAVYAIMPCLFLHFFLQWRSGKLRVVMQSQGAIPGWRPSPAVLAATASARAAAARATTATPPIADAQP